MYRLTCRGQGAAEWARPEGIPPLIYQLLRQRGIGDEAEARAFLYPRREDLHDPLALEGMAEAVERIKAALAAGERICVYGDYDVDGVCASAILSMYLKSVGAACEVYIPDRHTEGYGLNMAAIDEIAARADLMIAVDCGISCRAEVARARSLGLDVIVTDHHRPPRDLPECVIVNPLIGDYPSPILCGSGVAFKLVHALGGPDRALDYVDLAALATVADLVPLQKENRLIVALGLQAINARPRPGVKLLIDKAGLSEKTIGAGHVAFNLAPRINASGRLGDAKRAFALLTCDRESDGELIAQDLEDENTRRRAETNAIVAKCREMLASYDLLRHRAIVLCGEGWNAGVIGLVASQLVQLYHYPVVMLTETDGQCIGSCRSIPAVDIFEALSACAPLFTRYGGHRQAAGLAMPKANIEALIEGLDEYIAAHTEPDDFIPEAEYDISCDLGELTVDAVRMLDLMQPTGLGNPSPVFWVSARIDGVRPVGRDGAHLQLKLSQGGQTLQGIAFGKGQLAAALDGATRDMLFSPTINEWRSAVNVQCEIRELLTEPADEAIQRAAGKYRRYLRAFLTELLYNTDIGRRPLPEPAPLQEAELAGWLRASPQGTVVAAISEEGMDSLLAFLKAGGLTERLDTVTGQWHLGPAPMNAVCLCPVGPAPLKCRRLVLWDAPAEAFASLPDADGLFVGTVRGGWTDALPDTDALRQIYVACRRYSAGMTRVALSDIEREIARETGLDEDVTVPAGLGVLNHMGLIAVDRAAARLTVPPAHRADPAEDSLYQRLQGLKRP